MTGGIFISEAPEDPIEKQEWVNSMIRIQIAIYVDEKATCEECGYTYKSVDDFIRCNPIRGHTQKMSFVCSNCYPQYKEKNPIPNQSTVQVNTIKKCDAVKGTFCNNPYCNYGETKCLNCGGTMDRSGFI